MGMISIFQFATALSSEEMAQRGEGYDAAELSSSKDDAKSLKRKRRADAAHLLKRRRETWIDVHALTIETLEELGFLGNASAEHITQVVCEQDPDSRVDYPLYVLKKEVSTLRVTADEFGQAYGEGKLRGYLSRAQRAAWLDVWKNSSQNFQLHFSYELCSVFYIDFGSATDLLLHVSADGESMGSRSNPRFKPRVYKRRFLNGLVEFKEPPRKIEVKVPTTRTEILLAMAGY